MPWARHAFLALPLVTLLPVAASAQAPSEEIIVTASKATPREIEAVARSVMPPGNLYHSPLAQFQEPVCPAVIGMPAVFAASMVARIRDVAGRARIRLAKPAGCKANLLVIFMPSGQSAMRNLLHKGPWLFGNMAPAELEDLATDPALNDLAADPGPVHAWVNTEVRGRYGEGMTGRGDPSDAAVVRTADASSRLFMATRRDIVASLVVIDIPAVNGMTVQQIADYAAMRGLVQTRPPGKPGMIGTILGLFDENAVPPLEMTRFDLAYLRAVYGSSPNVAAITKVGRVANEVKKARKAE